MPLPLTRYTPAAVPVITLAIFCGAAIGQESPHTDAEPARQTDLDADDGPRHLPHAFDFNYTTEVVVLEGVVLGTWYGNTHSAVFFEPTPSAPEETMPEAPEEGTTSLIAPPETGGGTDDSVIPEGQGSPLSPGTPPAPESPTPAIAFAPDAGELPPEPEPDPTWWELETYPLMSLERGGWEKGVLAPGDPVVVAILPADTPLHAQLLGISRTTDGWTGLGHPFPDDFDMTLAVEKAREARESALVPEGDTDVSMPGATGLPNGVQ